MSKHELLNYDEISAALDLLNAEMTAASAHGMLAGWLCVKPVDEKGWEQEIFPKIAVSQQIKEAFYFIATQLEASDFEFQLLLPTDDEPLQSRSIALAEWCGGFLLGFGLTGFDIESNAEVKEAISDIAEITKLDEEDIVDDDEHENMFVEIEEFVRMAALLVYVEVHGHQMQENSEEVLH